MSDERLRSELLRIASDLPKGDGTRRDLLAVLRTAGKYQEGSEYEVVQRGARLSWDVSTGPWSWTIESIDVPVGTVLTFMGWKKGRGSDTVPMAYFRWPRKRVEGAFEPNTWGSPRKGFLVPVE